MDSPASGTTPLSLTPLQPTVALLWGLLACNSGREVTPLTLARAVGIGFGGFRGQAKRWLILELLRASLHLGQNRGQEPTISGLVRHMEVHFSLVPRTTWIHDTHYMCLHSFRMI